MNADNTQGAEPSPASAGSEADHDADRTADWKQEIWEEEIAELVILDSDQTDV